MKSLDSEGEKETSADRFIEFNEETMMDDPQFCMGMLFTDAEQVRKAIREYAILNRKKIRWVKNEPSRIRVKCSPPCEWMIYVSRIGIEDTMQVKTYQKRHENCRPVFEKSSIKCSWLALHYKETFRWNPKWPIQAFQQQVRVDFGTQIARSTLFEARRKAWKLLLWDEKEQYKHAYHYCKTLRHIMPGTSTTIDYINCNEGGRFRRMYVALGPLKKGFLDGCRPIICVDACFLSGRYKGQLMAAVGLDANDGMWPFAYAVVEKETKKSWTWFLEQLVKDISLIEPRNLTVMSDQQKGLKWAMEKVIPEANHRFCVRHIHSNMAKKFGGLGVKKAFYKCARATTVEYYNIKLEELKKKKYRAWSWLERRAPSPDHWSKSHFNEKCKSDIITSNHVEIFNKFILDARSLPIIDLFEKIRCLIQKRVRTNRDIMARYPGRICPRIVEKMEKNKKLCAGWIARWDGGCKYEVVTPTYNVVVDLNARKCDCRRWQLTGIPCSHAMCALMWRAEDPDDFVHICYATSTYLKSYENIVAPLCGPELWEHSYKQTLFEPIVEAQTGRPKKKRNKALDEPRSVKLKKSRSKKISKCGKCGSEGHNRRTCPVAADGASTSGV